MYISAFTFKLCVPQAYLYCQFLSSFVQVIGQQEDAPEQLVTLRVMLAMRVGESICIEPSTAAFLLPVDLIGISLLEETAIRERDAIAQHRRSRISLCIADADFVEVTLEGTWISTDVEAENGLFVTRLSDRTELLLCKLGQQIVNSATATREID
jgi:hypothetical protein